MFIINSKLGNLTLTLVFYVAFFLAVSVCSDAKGLHLQHRDHANLKRLIKKRVPQTLVPIIGAGAAVPVITPSSSADTTTTTATTTSSTTSSATESTTSGTTSGTETTTSSSTSSSSTPISSSTSTSQSSTPSSTTPSTTSSPPASQPPSSSVPSTPVSAPPKSTVTQVESVIPTSTASSVPVTQSGASTTKSTTLTVIIVIASCVAGVAIFWTVFRKWKLGRSSKFDERLQPIDWHPTGAEDVGQRRFSTGASSFHSLGSHGGGSTGAGVTGGYGGSDHGHGGHNHIASPGLPEHDFTAGPATFAPVGGYADLARGSSPQPSMQQIGRGPSMSRPTYDIGVPLHHQGGYSAQDAYGGLKA